MASIWDGLRAEVLLTLLLEHSDAYSPKPDGEGALPGVGTFDDGSFAHGLIDKHFDSLKGSLELFGGHRLIVERDDDVKKGLLVGIVESDGRTFVSTAEAARALREDVRVYMATVRSDGKGINFRSVYESFVKGAKEAFSEANGLETEAQRLSGGGGMGMGMGLPSIPQVEGMSAADNLRLMMTLQSLEGANAKAAPPVIPPYVLAIQDALAGLTLDTVDEGLSLVTCTEGLASAGQLYSGLLTLSKHLGDYFGKLAMDFAAASGKPIDTERLRVMKDRTSFLAAVISHQRRYLSNPGALGPRVAFPVSVFDQVLVHHTTLKGTGEISDAFMTLRHAVEYPHLSANTTSADDEGVVGHDEAALEAMMKRASIPPPGYFATLRIL